MARDITLRQQQVLNTIQRLFRQRSYMPTVRELADVLRVTPATMMDHLRALERKGALVRDPLKSRALRLPGRSASRAGGAWVNLPLLGTIAAGRPVLAEEHWERTVPVPEELGAGEDAFLLRVRGESMADAGIADGDLVVVRRQARAESGDIVAACIDEDATVKRWVRRRGAWWLEPANAAFEPMKADARVRVLGKVVGLLRKYA